jgi:DNA replication protein DnaC
VDTSCKLLRRRRLQKQFAAHRLLIIDELGYVPLSPTGTELLFEVFLHRRRSGPLRLGPGRR